MRFASGRIGLWTVRTVSRGLVPGEVWQPRHDRIAEVSDAGRYAGDGVAGVGELLRCAADTGPAR